MGCHAVVVSFLRPILSHASLPFSVLTDHYLLDDAVDDDCWPPHQSNSSRIWTKFAKLDYRGRYLATIRFCWVLNITFPQLVTGVVDQAISSREQTGKPSIKLIRRCFALALARVLTESLKI